MAKNDNAHSIRMVESLEKNIGCDVAEEFAEQNPLAKSAGIVKKFQWAKATCDYLEEHFDEATIMKVRKACRCNDEKSIANKFPDSVSFY